MKLAEFKEPYRQARGELMAQSYARIQQSTGNRADQSYEQEKKAQVDERLTQVEKVVGIDANAPRQSPKAA